MIESLKHQGHVGTSVHRLVNSALQFFARHIKQRRAVDDALIERARRWQKEQARAQAAAGGDVVEESSSEDSDGSP